MNTLADFIPASRLDDVALTAQLKRVTEVIDRGFGEHGGSPGEFWYERLNELEHEKSKRDS